MLAHTCRAFVIAALTISSAAAQSDTRVQGDYALAVDGTVIMTVHLTQNGAALGGSVSAGGKTLPLSGSVRDGRAAFTTGSPESGFLYWDARPAEQGLAVTLAPATADGKPDISAAQQHMLTRQAGGGTGVGAAISQASQQWIARLSAVADSITVWCAAPSFKESDLCVKAMQVLRRVAPALMVARFTTGGQAASLMRVLASGPGGAAGNAAVGAPSATAIAPTGDLFAALQPPVAQPASVRPDPAPVAQAPPPQSVPPTPSRSGVSAMGTKLASGATGGSRNGPPVFSGDWMLYVNGTEIASLRFDPTTNVSSATGTIAVMGDPKPFSGSIAAGALDFPFSAPDGTPTQWHLVPQDGRLAATISGPNGTQRQLLERPGGWSETTPLAQEWRRTLEGRSVTRTTRTNGGASGGATSDFTAQFCPGGVLRTATRSTVSVYVPGVSGSQTARNGGTGTWRVVTRDGVAALVITTDDGTMQLGLRHGSGNALYLGEELVRMNADSCAP